MYEKIIENYINKLTLNDVTFFALKNNISLNNQELDYVYKTIKNNYKKLLGSEFKEIFLDAKKYLKEDNYKKICSLFEDYRKKFSFFLN